MGDTWRRVGTSKPWSARACTTCVLADLELAEVWIPRAWIPCADLPLDHELDGILARETRAPFSRLVVTPTPHLERSCTLAPQGVSELRPPGQAELLELGKRGPDRHHAPAPGRIRRLALEASEDALRLLELQERPALQPPGADFRILWHPEFHRSEG
jgi:hypothetical protein